MLSCFSSLVLVFFCLSKSYPLFKLISELLPPWSLPHVSELGVEALSCTPLVDCSYQSPPFDCTGALIGLDWVLFTLKSLKQTGPAPAHSRSLVSVGLSKGPPPPHLWPLPCPGPMQLCRSALLRKWRDVKKCPALRYKDDSRRRQKRLQVSHAERERLLWTEESNAQKVRELVKPCSILVLKSWMSKWRAQHRSPMRVSFPLNTQLRHSDCHFVLRKWSPGNVGCRLLFFLEKSDVSLDIFSSRRVIPALCLTT